MAGIAPLSVSPVTLSPAGRTGGAGSTTFGGLLAQAVTQIEGSQQQATQAIVSAMTGGGSITQAMTALQVAQLSLDVGIAARNGVAQAYQTIMNMPLS
jgi:flagellar hook-basal body complex protein FliE